MSTIDDFFRLKEYDSLRCEATAITEKMNEELTRIKRLDGELSLRQEKLLQREAELRGLVHQLAELDKRLTQRLSIEMKGQIEEEGLGIMVRQQDLEQQIEDDRTFIAGFSRTCEEIRVEIDQQLKVLSLQRDQALKRAELLFAALPDGWAVVYQRISLKKPTLGVFSRILQQHCHFCRHAVSKVIESEVDAQGLLRACDGCGRLFLPYKAVAG